MLGSPRVSFCGIGTGLEADGRDWCWGLSWGPLVVWGYQGVGAGSSWLDSQAAFERSGRVGSPCSFSWSEPSSWSMRLAMTTAAWRRRSVEREEGKAGSKEGEGGRKGRQKGAIATVT